MFSEELLFDPLRLRVYVTLALYVIAPVVIIAIFRRKQWMQRCGTVIAAYAVGLLLALTGVTHFTPDSMEEMLFQDWHRWIMNLSIPLAIPLMLFNCDFKLWTKALPKTILALLAGLVAVIGAVLSGYYLLKSLHIPAFEKIAALMTGMYTGGTMNFNALGAALNVDNSLMAVVLAFEMLITVLFLFFVLGGGFRLIRRLLPYTDETTPKMRRQFKQFVPPVQDVEDYDNMFSRENFWGMLAGLGLSVLFLLAGAGVSYLCWKTGLIPPDMENPERPVMNELIIIMVITTLSIGASFFRGIRELPKTFELGMFFILIFSVSLSSLFDWHSVQASTWSIGVFIVWVLVAALLLQLLFCRLMKVSGDLYTISVTALFCSPPFVPPVVGAMGNKKVLISGIVIGLIGYAIGTYLGVGVAWLLGAL